MPLLRTYSGREPIDITGDGDGETRDDDDWDGDGDKWDDGAEQEMTKQMVKPGEDYGERDDDGKANKQTVPRLSSPQLRAGLTV